MSNKNNGFFKHWISTVAISGVLLSSAASLQAATLSGTITGDLGVNQGRLSYSVPVSVPKGRAGMQPDLSITYGAGGSGLMGVGWGLSGLSMVSRCNATFDTDGFVSSVSFTNTTDRFCLDGQRLIPIQGSNGGDGTEYRTEIDSYARVISYGVAGSGPAYWKVWTKAGQIMEFGNTPDSRIEAQGKASVMTWAVNEIRDTTVDGNAMTVTYAEYTDRTEYVPTRIDYVGGSVEFNYTDEISLGVGYIAGSRMERTKRVTDVTIKDITGAVFQQWKMHYQVRNDKPSLLTHLELCDGQNTCLPKTQFVWEDEEATPLTSAAITSSGTWPQLKSGSVFIQSSTGATQDVSEDATQSYLFTDDFDGDGRTDIAYWDGNHTSQVGSWMVQKGKADGTFASPVSWLSGHGYLWSQGQNLSNQNMVYSGDFNADGRADIMYIHTTTSNGWQMLLSEGDHFRHESWGGGANPIYPDWLNYYYYDVNNISNYEPIFNTNQAFHQLGDFNGDGLLDLMFWDKNNWQVLRNTGSGFVRENWGNGGGDGHWVGHNKTITRPINGSSHQFEVAGDSTQSFHFTGDFNGDGRTDFMHWQDGWRVLLSNGNSFEGSDWGKGGGDGHWLDHASKVSTQSFHFVGDFNGDGLSDFMYYNNTQGWMILKSDGTTFLPEEPWGGAPKPDRCQFSCARFSDGSIFHNIVTGNPAQCEDYHNEGGPNGVHVPFVCPYDSSYQYSYQNVSSEPGEFFTSFEDTNIRQTYQLALDVNGDGRTDLLFKPSKTSSWSVLKSKGDAFELITDYAPSDAEATAIPKIGVQGLHQLGDVDGDGGLDFVYWRAGSGNDHSNTSYNFPNGQWHVRRSEAPKIRIVGIIDGLHNWTSITYAKLTDPSVYTPATGASYPERDLTGPMEVVSRIESNDGIGGSNYMDYYYEGARLQSRGRGYLGFSKITNISLANGKKTVSFYRQDYPHIGSASRIEEYVMLDGGQYQLLNEKDTEYGTNTNNPHLTKGIHAPVMTRMEDNSYELDGSWVTSALTENTQFDTYGNIGQVSITTSGGGQTFKEIAVSQYSNIVAGGRWLLGRLYNSYVTHEIVGSSSETKSVAYTYDQNTGLLLSETIEPGALAHITKTTSYAYDAFGNITSTTESAWPGPDQGLQLRTVTTAYDANSRLGIAVQNTLGHQDNIVNDPGCGTTLQQTGPNNLATTWTYDFLCRKLTETRSDGTRTEWAYEDVAENDAKAPLHAVQVMTEIRFGAGNAGALPPAIQYVDILGRTIRTITTGLNGREVYNDTEFDNRGRVLRKSLPYYSGDKAYWVSSKFDPADRLLEVYKPGPDGIISTTRMGYSGLTWTNIDVLGHKTVTQKDARGDVKQIVQAQGTPEETLVLYEHDANRNLVKTTASGIITTIVYDSLGRKTSMNDPDMGIWSYGYNGFGELIRQTDAKGQVVSTQYDVLGRKISRTEPEGTSTWQYDVGNKAIGKPYRTEQKDPNGQLLHRVTNTYDDLGRPSSTTTEIDGHSYVVSSTYDDFSRVEKTTRPGGFEVESVYNQHGFMIAKRSPAVQVVGQTQHLQQLQATALQRAQEALDAVAGLQTQADYYRTQALNYQNLADGSGTELARVRSLTQDASQLINGKPYALQQDASGNLFIEMPDRVLLIHGDVLTPILIKPEAHYQLLEDTGGWRLQAIDLQTWDSTIKPGLSDSQQVLYKGDYDADGGADVVVLAAGSGEPVTMSAELLQQLNNTSNFTAPNIAAPIELQQITGSVPAEIRNDIAYALWQDNAGDYYLNSQQEIVILHGVVPTPIVLNRKPDFRLVQIAPGQWQLIALTQAEMDQLNVDALRRLDRPVQIADVDSDGATDFRFLDQEVGPLSQRLAVSDQVSTDDLRDTSEAARAAADALNNQVDDYLELAEQLLRVADNLENQLRQAQLWAGSGQDGLNTDAVAADNTNAQNAANGYITFWQATEQDAAGRLVAHTTGNGLREIRDYHPGTGQQLALESGFDYGRPIRSVHYRYDALDNVLSREDRIQDLTERFSYDNLDRLITADITRNGDGSQLNQSLSYAYDALGNITNKSDVGAYTYGNTDRSNNNAGPHALISAGPNHSNYQYDNNGNILSGGGRNFEWTSYNKPRVLQKGSTRVEFDYAADRARYRKQTDTGEITHYIGKAYERVEKDGEVTDKHFIYAGGDLVAVHSRTVDNGVEKPRQTQYMHRDSLGSIDTVTDGYGNVIERNAYDPWGKRRKGNWQDDVSVSLKPLTKRGYTGHEHIDELGLIHMNGRVYDPTLGRFLSADPFIQAPNNSQSYNRYAYVWNNPMKYTDPSGYFLDFVTDIFRGVGRAIGSVVRGFGRIVKAAIRNPIVQTVISTVVGFYCPVCLPAVNSFFTLVNGGTLGDVIRSTALSYTFGSNPLVAAVEAKLSGDNFGRAFASAFFGELVAPLKKANIVLASLLGGVQSVIGGGKFKNGAATAAARYATLRYLEYREAEKESAPAKQERASKDNNSMQQSGGNERGTTCHPINIATGEKYLEMIDYQSAEGRGLAFIRHYRSYAQEKGTMGYGWRSNFDRKLEFVGDDSEQPLEVVYHGVEREKITFTQPMDKGWFATKLRKERLYQEGKTWVLVKLNNNKEIYDAKGRLIRIESLGGYSQFLGYDDKDRLVEVTDSFGARLQLNYSRLGLLTSVVDPEGNAVRYRYNLRSRVLTQVIYPDGTETLEDNGYKRFLYQNKRFPTAITGIVNERGQRLHTMAYDYHGRAVLSALGGDAERVDVTYHDNGSNTVRNSLGRDTTYHFDSANRPVSIQGQATKSCIAANQAYTYDDAGNKLTETDWKGLVTRFSYNDRGLEIRRVEAEGTDLERVIETQWHDLYRLPVRVVEQSKTTELNYDEQGLLISRTELDTQASQSFLDKLLETYPQRTTNYQYNAQGLLTQVDGPRTDVDDIITYAYDDKGNRIRTTNALGHTAETLEVDDHGRPLMQRDANGLETHMVYNERGWLLSKTRSGPQGSVQTNIEYLHSGDYKANGIISRIRSSKGDDVRFHYDSADRLIALENGLGERQEYTLDLEGNRIAEATYDAQGNVVAQHKRVFDELSRLIADIGAYGQTTAYQYDENGNLLEIQDPANNTQLNTYDALNRLTATLDPQGGVVQQAYDNSDRLIAVTDQRGLTTEYRYNGFGDKMLQSSPDTGETFYRRNEAGLLVEKTDARGMRKQYFYDALGRVTQIHFPDAPEEDVHYGYDAQEQSHSIGRMSSIVAPSGTTALQYNQWGALSQRDYDIEGTTYQLRRFYNEQGLLTAVRYPSGRVVQYHRDPLGRITAVSTKSFGEAVAEPVVTQLGYAPFGGIAHIEYANGLTLTMRRDLDERIANIYLGSSANDNTYLDKSYRYDAVGNIVRIADYINPDQSKQYAYDDLSRLIKADGSYGSISYQYDGVGNRTERMHVTAAGAVLSESYEYATDSNRLLTVTSNSGEEQKQRSLSYDAIGNLVKDLRADSPSLSLIYNADNRLKSAANDVSEDPSLYRYDVEGRRIAKTAWIDGRHVTTHFHYDVQGNLIAETDAAGNTVKEYLYIGKHRVALIDASQGHSFFIHNNHLGSPELMTDADQKVVWTANALPFGASANAEDRQQSLRFPGQYADRETGYYQNHFRDYDPTLGRYIQSDPIGLNGGINTFGYVSGNPLSMIDLSGLSEADVLSIKNAMDDFIGQLVESGERFSGSGSANGWTGNLFGKAGCIVQACGLSYGLNSLNNVNGYFDDDWTFEVRQRGFFEGGELVGPHKWVVGKSSNPNDPFLEIDPWAGEFREHEEDTGHEKYPSCSK